MAELVRGGEPLDAHRPFGGHQNAGDRIVQVGAEQVPHRAKEQRHTQRIDRTEHVNRPTGYGQHGLGT